MNDPSIEVVMHAAGEDLRICHLKTGSLPRRVFDVQIAAGLIGLSYPLVAGQSGFSGAFDEPLGKRDAHRLASSAALDGAARVRTRRRSPPARPGRPFRRLASRSLAAVTGPRPSSRI